MSDDFFQFKKFKIRQNYAAMKVNTDSVLLAAWAVEQLNDSKTIKNILDIGTGTGLLTLQMAQKFPDANFTAIELDADSCLDADFNFKNSDWSDQIQLQNIDFRNFLTSQKFDIMISNPPYFEPIQTNKGQNKQWPTGSRNIARFYDSLNFDDLATSIEKCNEGGSFFVVIPFQNLGLLEESFLLKGWFRTKYCYVHTKINKACTRVLCQFNKEISQFNEEQLILHHLNMERTKHYLNLVSNYYI